MCVCVCAFACACACMTTPLTIKDNTEVKLKCCFDFLLRKWQGITRRYKRQGIASLPSELKENFGEIRKLDERFEECQKRLEEQYEQELEDGKKAFEADSMLQPFCFSRKATDAAAFCKEVAEQKVKLATQTYEKVDGHVRRLDKYLKKFDQELRRESNELKGESTAFEPRLNESGAIVKEGDVKANRKKRQVVEKLVSEDLDLPIDPNEPTYCYCQNVSFGKMIACDNENCKIEWFHFQCVGIKDQPKGKWYCPDCAPKMKQRRRG
eukprot:c20456_g1_i2 orf=457-1257(-)